MAEPTLTRKAFWVLRHEGPLAMARKTVKMIRRRLTARHTASEQTVRVNEVYEYLRNPVFQISDADITASQAATLRPVDEVRSALWFVPYFDHITYGGIYTIFRFVADLAKRGVATTVVIYDKKYLDVKETRREMVEHFPELAGVDLIALDMERHGVNDLPASDIAFATIWMSAYLLLKYNKARRKYYFIQDYEPLFYQAGSMYALAESTYRFGFAGVVNTPGLLRAVNQRHGMEGISFTPAVDRRYYYQAARPANERLRIFFYARPNNPRNAFELGILTIRLLLERYGDKIEIVTAGADWNEAEYGLDGVISNRGLLGSLREVGDLYRGCDVGFVFMLSKHPSYQPFEFMACGLAAVTNRNEDNGWLFEDWKNCVLSEPSPAAMAEAIGRLIEDGALRSRIAKAGAETVKFDWETELDSVWNYISRQ